MAIGRARESQGKYLAGAGLAMMYLVVGPGAYPAGPVEVDAMAAHRRLLYIFSVGKDPSAEAAKTVERGGEYGVQVLIGPKTEPVKYVYRHPLRVGPSEHESASWAWTDLKLDSYVFPYFEINYRGAQPVRFRLSFSIDIDNDGVVDFLAYAGEPPANLPGGGIPVGQIHGAEEVRCGRRRWLSKLYEELRKQRPDRLSFLVKEVRLAILDGPATGNQVVSSLGFYQEETRAVSFIRKRVRDLVEHYGVTGLPEDAVVVVDSGVKALLRDSNFSVTKADNVEVSGGRTGLLLKLVDPTKGRASFELTGRVTVEVARHPLMVARFPGQAWDASGRLGFADGRSVTVKLEPGCSVDVREAYRQVFGGLPARVRLNRVSLAFARRDGTPPAQPSATVDMTPGEVEFYNHTIADPYAFVEKISGPGTLKKTVLFELAGRPYGLGSADRETINRTLTGKTTIGLGRVSFSSGERVSLRAFKSDYLEVLNVFLEEMAQPPGDDPVITFQRINPTRYVARVEATGPFWLMLNETFHAGWRAYVVKADSPQLGSESSALQFAWNARERLTPLTHHTVLNAYANGWWVPREAMVGRGSLYNFSIVIEFYPQRLFEVGLLISGVTVVGMVAYLLAYGIKRWGRRGVRT